MTPSAAVAGTQRVAVLTSPGTIDLQSRPRPEPGEGSVQVQVTAVTVCGSDVHYFDHGRIGGYVMRGPLVLGHETAGVVTAVGSGVSGPAVGTRVAIEPQVSCGACRQCRGGRYHLCPDVRFFATPPVDGSLAEFVVVPAERAHPVPDSLSDEVAALIEPLSVALHAADKAAVSPGTRVLVSGAGPIGLLCLQVALVRGAHDVTVTEISPDRRAQALDYGAARVVEPGDGAGVPECDVVLECTGVPAAIGCAIGATAPAARVVLIGTGSEVTLPLDVIQARELVLYGSFRYAHTYPTAIALAATGRLRLDDLITSRHDLDDVEAALLSARRDPRALKSVVLPRGAGGTATGHR